MLIKIFDNSHAVTINISWVAAAAELLLYNMDN
jgi:hypothetical protein